VFRYTPYPPTLCVALIIVCRFSWQSTLLSFRSALVVPTIIPVFFLWKLATLLPALRHFHVPSACAAGRARLEKSASPLHRPKSRCPLVIPSNLSSQTNPLCSKRSLHRDRLLPSCPIHRDLSFYPGIISPRRIVSTISLRLHSFAGACHGGARISLTPFLPRTLSPLVFLGARLAHAVFLHNLLL